MEYIFSFEKLNVWIDSKELVKLIYLVTKDFPSEEKFGSTNQLKRASISVASNLAEGTSRKNKQGQISFHNTIIQLINGGFKSSHHSKRIEFFE